MNVSSPKTGSKIMNKNILIVLGGAVLAAVLVAVLVQVTLGGKKPTKAPDSAVEVLVAAKDLKKGVDLKAEHMAWKKWSDDALFRGAIIRKGDQKTTKALKGRLDRSFSEGEALVKKSIFKSKGNYVAAKLKEGERAISIKLKAEDMVAGFISPGSYVDVILTYSHRVTVDREEQSNIKEMMALNIDRIAVETILENIRILAIDQRAENKSDDKVKIGKTVTLAVSIRDAEALAIASEMGSLTLALRGVGDDAANKVVETLTDARLISVDDEIREKYMELKKDSGVNLNSVKIYSGAQVQTIPVR